MAITLDGTNGINSSGVIVAPDGSAAAPAITNDADTNTGIFFPAADRVGVSTGGAQRVEVDASGNVGIGVVPSAWDSTVRPVLSVKASTGSFSLGSNGVDNARFLSNAYFSGGFKRIAAGYASQYEQNAGTHIWYTADTSTADSAITFVERARLTSGGQLLIGTTSDWFGRILIVDRASGDAAVFITNAAASAGVNIHNTVTSGDNSFAVFYTEARGAPSGRGSIDYNRGAGLTRYNTTSDATLKNIIGDSDGQKSVEILNSTRIRKFAWKEDETQKPQIGVIAQELYETFKGAVSVGGDIEKTDEEGNVTTEYRPWGVDKTAFTFHLVAGWQTHEKMIQELKAINDAQASRIETLEAKVAALEANNV